MKGKKMEEQLIELAKKKGFFQDFTAMQVSYSHLDIYYLWMCELQKWLREQNSFIYVTVRHSLHAWVFKVETSRISKESVVRYYTYEIALESGLLEALNLLP